MLRIGLTGGIACGKSRVRRQLAAAGFGTLDLDAVAHEMIAPGGPAYPDVVAAFGRGILAADGTVDRKVLGARVFADAAAAGELGGPERAEEFARKGYLLVGDVHAPSVRERAGALTPVPGGVGPLTIAMLMSNTVSAAERTAGLFPSRAGG